MLFASYAAEARESPGAGYWVILAFGCAFLLGIIGAIGAFLVFLFKKEGLVRQQETFIDSVTHELRSPIASLGLTLDTLDRRELTDEARRRLLDMMRADVLRLRNYVDQVLLMSRIAEHDRVAEISSVDLVAVIARCVLDTRQRHALGEDAITVDVHATLRDTSVATDGTVIEIVLRNLLDNAVKYSPAPPRITVAARRLDGRIELTVSDRGEGLDKRELQRVFRRFHQVARPGKAPVRGTGLGLHVARELVLGLGGTIVAESEGLERGSTFRLSIPESRQ